MQDFAFQARAQGGIFQTLDEGLRASFVRPRRNDAGQIVLASAIGIHIGLHFEAFIAGARDGRHQLRHLAPHGVLRDLQVNDVHRYVSAAADLDGFCYRFENAPAFGAHVRRVAATIRSRSLAHGHQRIGIDP